MKKVGRPAKDYKRVDIKLDREIYDAIESYRVNIQNEKRITFTEIIEAALLFLLDSGFSPKEARDFIDYSE